MKTIRNLGKKTNTIFIMLLLTISILFIGVPFTTAQTEQNVETYAFVAAAPNPIGVGQSS